jgi:L,D-peptidoglycan transpeptidase YkuD (ErfK/YbiS/YcfS/YnhG family)
MRVRTLAVTLGCAVLVAACTSGRAEHPAAPSPSAAPTSSTAASSTAAATPAPSTTTSRPTPRATSAKPAATTSARPTPRPTTPRYTPPPQPTTHAALTRLPLGYPTHAATQVITVVASSRSSTTATLQPWRRTSRGWSRVGGPVAAWLGTDGMTAHPSESQSATPMGSFTLTQAFGHDPDPGTRLPYVHTTPAYWWISQPGSLYNTMQHCASDCAFRQGDPNEHLYYETPYYNYAVVIDYNRYSVEQGAGSAFFLHVTVGAPTQGCVSIAQSQLVRIMCWLDPRDHPRILIGTG